MNKIGSGVGVCMLGLALALQLLDSVSKVLQVKGSF